jgi:phospholipase/carboxylesterase
MLFPRDGARPRELILFLHGVSSNGDLILPVRHRLRTSFPQALIVAPHAPKSCGSGDEAYQWWRLKDLKPRSLAAGVRQAAPALNRFIDEMLAATGLSDDRLVLTGFSQGAMLALQTAISRPRPIAGVAAFSGMLAHRAMPWRLFGQKPPVLLVHGTDDTIIPPSAHFDAERRLSAYGCRVEAHMRTGLGHRINGAGYVLGERFIQTALGYSSPKPAAFPKNNGESQ